MQYSTLSVALSLLPFTLAQYGSGGSDTKSSSTASAAAASSTSSSSGTVHTVKVGDGDIVFSPNSMKAAVGDSVEFHFYPATHSVAQSSFAAPCVPLNDTSFFSGGVKTASGMNDQVFTITVTDASPIWYYCGFPGHCAGGMAGVINPPADGSKTIEQYIAAAANATSSAPSKVQGGTLGPAKAQSSGSPTGSTTSSPSPTASGSAAVEARGGVSWTMFALTGFAAMGFGGLIL
ncbi:Cupredoxin [Rhexocercosporidium sp. MPI-PUGE-AT-0058]|nr:Cupredoxin [Rhexocercosporidium sp. MPI-PUGE-AT-0058]